MDFSRKDVEKVGYIIIYVEMILKLVYFPTRFCWLSIRQFSSLLFFSVVLLTTYHLCKRNPQQEFVITNSVYSPSQESSNDMRGISSTNHKLLQYYDDSLDIIFEQQPVLNGRSKDTISNNNRDHVHVPYEEQSSYVKQPSSVPFTTDSSQLSHVSTPSLQRHNVAEGKAVQKSSMPLESYSQNKDNHASEEPISSLDSHTHFEKWKDTQSAHDHCDVSGIKSWNKGIITELHPRIQANCELMRNNDRQEIERVKKEIKSWKSSESEEEWIESLSDCEKVVQEFSNNFYNSPEEIDFPLAYILVVYTNPQQMVRFIKTLWRPQNIFCIHPDAKQSEEFIGIFRQLSKCLDNVFLPRKLEKVFYQHHTIMDSQLSCYEDLLHYYPSSQWKYVINLCGRELPLKTNREMVKSLKKLKGGSAIETKHVQLKGFLAKDRLTWKAAENYTSGKLFYTHKRLGPPPLPIYKSFNYIAVSRPFVNFFVNDKKAVEFRNYLKDVKTPEEEFYASLIHLPGVPGGSPPRGVPIPTIDKAIWTKKELCEGRMVHSVCIVSVGDLKHIYQWGVNTQPPTFFFNKYFMEDDHVVMDCMEERLLLQNIKEYETDCKHKPG